MSQIKLVQHQIEHYKQVCSILHKHYCYIDTSCMGLGKTVIAISVALSYGLSLFVVSPLSVLSVWESECAKYGATLIDAITYCKMRTSSYNNRWIKKIGDEYHTTSDFDEIIKSGILLVFDECHSLKNDSIQSKVARVLANKVISSACSSRIAALSATPCDKIEHVESLIKVTGLVTDDLVKFVRENNSYNYNGLDQLLSLCYGLNYTLTKKIRNEEIMHKYDKKTLSNLCYRLYTEVIKNFVSSSMPSPDLSHLKNIGNGFYDMSQQDLEMLKYGMKMLETYSNYDRKTRTSKKVNNSGVMRSMKIIERSKLNIILNLARRVLRQYQAKVIIYLNFIEHIKLVSDFLAEYNPLVLYGKVKKPQRKPIIDAFQNNTSEHRLLISNPNVGSEGISLDDRTGDWPRFVYVSPSYFFIRLHQLTGRTCRPVTTKSMSIIRFVFCKYSTGETDILDSLARKAEVTKNMTSDDKILYPGEYNTILEQDDF